MQLNGRQNGSAGKRRRNPKIQNGGKNSKTKNFFFCFLLFDLILDDADAVAVAAVASADAADAIEQKTF